MNGPEVRVAERDTSPVKPASRAPVPTPTRIGWLVLAVVVFCSYNSWVFWRPLNGHDEILLGYLSELSASDQPNDLFFRGDLISAVIALTLATGWLLHRRRDLHQHWRVVASYALVLFGVSTFFDAFFAMDCSPTLSAVCARWERTGQLSTIHYLHTGTSVGAQLGITVSLAAGTIALAKARTRRRGTLILVAALAAIEILALVVMMGMLADGIPGIGYPQAVMVAVAASWCALVAVGHAEPGVWTVGGDDELDETFELANFPDADHLREGR